MLNSLFENDIDVDRIVTALELQSGLKIKQGTTILIFDEVQEARGALSSLKYFQEEKPELHIIAAGSLLGVSLTGQSFPVGKVDFLHLNPMTFFEFLKAQDEAGLLELIHNKDWELIQTFRQKFISLLKKYYFVGGCRKP